MPESYTANYIVDSCPLYFKQWMVATHIKKIKQSMLCVTGVYLRDIANTDISILHLHVSLLSICCSYLLFDSGTFVSDFVTYPTALVKQILKVRENTNSSKVWVVFSFMK